MQQLKELQQQNLAGDGSVKVYYSRLTDILRVFLLRRLNISSMAETSEELIGQLRRVSMAPEQFAALAETLRMSDFVKFAKYQPAPADNEQHHQVMRNAVETLEGMAAKAELAARAAATATTETAATTGANDKKIN
jgi:hypothetical protein